MGLRWQYQALVEPVLVTAAGAEDVTLDKWFTPLAAPSYRKLRIANEGFLVKPLEPSLVTQPPELSWQPVPAQRKALPRPAAEGYLVEPLEPSLVVAPPELSWSLVTSQEKQPKKPPREGCLVEPLEPSLFTAPPALSWLPSVSETRQPRRVQQYWIAAPDPAVLTPNESLTVDKWAPPLQEPVRQKPKLAREGVFAEPLEPSLFTAPPELSWLPSTNTVSKAKKPKQETCTVEPNSASLQGETVTLDKWLPQVLQPLQKPRRVLGNDGASLLEPGSLRTPELTDWYQPLAEPIRLKPKPVREGGQVAPNEPSLYRTPDLSDWYLPLAEPTRLPRKLPREGGDCNRPDDSVIPVVTPTVTTLYRAEITRAEAWQDGIYYSEAWQDGVQDQKALAT